MSRVATVRNAALFIAGGAILWLTRLPALELGIFAGFPGETPYTSIDRMTVPVQAIVGLATIAAGTAMAAYAARRRHAGLASVLMILGLAILAITPVGSSDPMPILALGFGLFGAGWLALATAERSIAAATASVALATFALGLLPGGPLFGAFAVRDLAPAVFGLAVLAYVARGLALPVLAPADKAGDLQLA